MQIPVPFRHVLAMAALIGPLQLSAQDWNWATSGGGTSNDDFCQAIAMDSQGAVYYGGTTRGSNGQFGCGPVSVGATTGGVLAKYTADGQCLWLRTISVPSFEARVYAMAIDAEDRIYIAGSYRGTATFCDTIALASQGGTDLFIARYDTAGTCLWARRAGGQYATSEARGLALSADGRIFLLGKAGGNPVRAGNLELPNAGNGQQVFLASYDSTGAVQWARISSGTGGERSGRGISINGDRLFITGKANYAHTEFDGFSLADNISSGNLYVMACDLDGNGMWSHAFTGMANVEGTGIAADSLGNLFIAGSLWGRLDLPGDTLQSVSSNDDILLMGMDQEGNYRWGHSAGSTGRDLAWGVVADGMGNAYLAAQFAETMELLGQPFTVLGSLDALIFKLRADGSPVWFSQPSGYQTDLALCIYRQPVPPHKLAFGGSFWGTITYGSSTISDVQNGDGMLVVGADTTFAANVHTTGTCPGACDGTRTVFLNGNAPFQVEWADGSSGNWLGGQCAGTLNVEVTDAHGQTINLASTVPVYPDPEMLIQQQNDSLWIEGGTSWQWYFNGSAIPQAEARYHLPAGSGAYHVAYTGPGGCPWSSDTVQVVLGVGLAYNAPHLAIRAYPVPAKDILHIESPHPISHARGWNNLGQVRPIAVLGGRSLNLTGLAAGIWLIETTFTDQQSQRLRIVISE